MSLLTRYLLPLCLIIFLILEFTIAWVGRGREKTTKHAWFFVAFYAFVGMLAGILFPIWESGWSRQAYFATWATEYSLSIDNLLVFFIIFKKLGINSKSQELLLLIGISGSFILRSLALFFGVVLVDSSKIMFAFLGVILLYTSYKIFREKDSSWVDGAFYKRATQLRFSLKTISILLIVTADLFFAVDSIPAAVGLSTNLPLMLAATFFAIMGLRHLYFVVAEAAMKIQLLSKGLGLALSILGFKLIFSACADYGIRKILFVPLPVFNTRDTFLSILIILVGAICLSIVKNKRDGNSIK